VRAEYTNALSGKVEGLKHGAPFLVKLDNVVMRNNYVEQKRKASTSVSKKKKLIIEVLTSIGY